VDDRVLAVSPCHRVRLPHDDRVEVVVSTVEQITTLTSGVPARYRALVVLLAGSGLRTGEALGLGKSDLDFLGRTVKVKRQRLPSGVMGPPKTSKSARTSDGQIAARRELAHRPVVRNVGKVRMRLFSL
jgi:integrase